MDSWLIDGVPGATVSADDRGLHYGDGLFETIAVRGGRCRFLDHHLARLRDDSARLGIVAPAAELLAHELQQLIPDSTDGTAKIVLTRGSGPRGYAPPADSTPVRMLGFTAGAPSPFPSEGVRLCFCETPAATSPALAGIKSLNRLEQVLARAELQDSGYAEGIMLDAQGRVVCGTMSNVFVVAGESLLTPKLETAGVSGIMRARVVDIAENAGINVSETDMSRADLLNAEAVFLTNALIGMWPVAELEGASYPVVNGIVEQVRTGLVALGVTECSA